MKRNHTFLTGVFMAINAITDSYLIIDGCDCIYKKIEVFDKNHDYRSRIFSRTGHHRINATHVTPDSIIHDRESEMISLLKSIDSYHRSGCIMLTTMPIAQITGIDYRRLLSDARTEKPAFDIPYRTLEHDWLDGYSTVLKRIAEDIEIKPDKRKDAVAIIGYLFDRHEGDNTGNINEMKRLLYEIGLETVSIWLDGNGFDNLERVGEAELIISLPYAREAAKILGKRTGAKVIDLGLPFGLQNTSDWLKRIAEATGKDADRLIEKEMKNISILETVVPRYLQGKSVVLVGDPYLSESMASALEELDMRIMNIIAYSRPRETNRSMLFESDNPGALRPDIGIGNSEGGNIVHGRYLEFGFPSFGRHHFTEKPCLGIKGFMEFINQIINTTR